MKPSPSFATLVALVACTLAPAAGATTCYVVFDRNDNVIYRDIFPPVDMSSAGTAARDAMRRRGEHLMFIDAERCPQVEFVTGSAGESLLDFTRTMAPTAAGTAPAPPANAARSAR